MTGKYKETVGMDKTRRSGALLASAAAALLLSGAAPLAAQAEEAKVQCLGVNACKGQSDCATANNGCQGQNACKGKGMKVMTEAECKAAGGTVKSD
uniref:Silver efflux pump n=1 Tax=uncultured bacterium UPO75 TaxID=1776992 RepID=A0A140DZW5_9BACT|nr:hypothetical protein Y88_0106 [uncultured bacterium UPO75]